MVRVNVSGEVVEFSINNLVFKSRRGRRTLIVKPMKQCYFFT